MRADFATAADRGLVGTWTNAYNTYVVSVTQDGTAVYASNITPRPQAVSLDTAETIIRARGLRWDAARSMAL